MKRRGFLSVLASIPIVGIVKNNSVPFLINEESAIKGISQSNRLKNLYISPEALEDIRNWGVNQIDNIARREIYSGN